MSERFYVNLPLAPGPITLDGAEARHLAAACRIRPGNEVCLFCGDGHEYPAQVTEIVRREVRLEILRVESPNRELRFRLEVAAPIPSGDRGHFLIEKLTELGTTHFVPLKCRFSNTFPREAKRDKLERHVIEASKQCGRNVLMTIDDIKDWDSYCTRDNPGEVRILAHPYHGESLANVQRQADDRGGSVRLAVGPEGGFADDELALAFAHSWRPVNLGPRILRIETAAIMLASVFTV